jgi:hypothetical protein
MKNYAIDDPAQLTDRERAFIDRRKAAQLCKCGEIKGKVSLTIPRTKATYFFKSMDELEDKRDRYELFEGEGIVRK